MADITPDVTIGNGDDAPKKNVGGRPRKDGLPPGTKTPTAAQSQDVKKALATLDSAYNLITMGLAAVGFIDTAEAWLSGIETVKLTNEDALKASPKLAKAIATTGNTGGSATFFLTHGLMLIGVVGVFRSELADKRADAILKTDPVPDSPNG